MIRLGLYLTNSDCTMNVEENLGEKPVSTGFSGVQFYLFGWHGNIAERIDCVLVKKIAAITGAGSGLGASLAKKYVEDGYHVCLLGRTEDKLERTAQDFPKEAHSIFSVDVSSKKEVSHVFTKIKENIGTVDILVNNAGVGVFDLAENLSEEAVHQMIDINLKGTIFCTQEILADMKERNSRQHFKHRLHSWIRRKNDGVRLLCKQVWCTWFP